MERRAAGGAVSRPEVVVWEESDVSDIDCTPRYDTQDLGAKILKASSQAKAKAEAEVKEEVKGVSRKRSLSPPEREEEVSREVPGATGELGAGKRFRNSRRFNGLAAGEGEAMAAYISSGQRIPRRGEVGWTEEDIKRFESSGYVMSGSRNRRITAVRLRKEAEVYTAEQQRALSLYTFEQRQQREKQVAAELAELLRKSQTEG